MSHPYFPQYSPTVTERYRRGEKFWTVTLTSRSHCDTTITAKATHADRARATDAAFAKLTDENTAAFANCVRHGKHTPEHQKRAGR